jgi:hypothetical protein
MFAEMADAVFPGAAHSTRDCRAAPSTTLGIAEPPLALGIAEPPKSAR